MRHKGADDVFALQDAGVLDRKLELLFADGYDDVEHLQTAVVPLTHQQEVCFISN